MATLWSYLLTQFFKVFFLCVGAFIAVLLTLRLDEIAHFASLGAPLWVIFRFVSYQIPYILPIAVPISCLIAVILLVQGMSQSHELTALRASGLSLFRIFLPLVLVAGLLSVVNFVTVSEVATHCHWMSNQLKKELRSINPLLLLHNKHLMQARGIFFDAQGASHLGESAEDILMAIPEKNSQRMRLILAQRLEREGSALLGKNVTILTSFSGEQEADPDGIYLENIGAFKSSSSSFFPFVRETLWTLQNDYLRFPFLLLRWKEGEKGAIANEIARRFSIALGAVTFVMMGIAVGLSNSRQRNHKGVLFALLFSTFFLLCYFSAGNVRNLLWLSLLLYILPHGMILLFSAQTVRRISQGVER